jgi:hypothetical protein
MSPTLALWQFGSAGMLAWGLAAALPLLIHLWSRRKYRQERWAAMAFLIAALRKNARRIQVEQWILLGVRSLILLFFALALADPQSSILSSWARPSGGPMHTVLVLDGSYSMDYRSGDGSRFQAAKKLARKIVAGEAPGAGYSLVLMSRPPRVIISGPAFNREEVLQEIGDLELKHTGADLSATLAEIETILRRSKAQSDTRGHETTRQVYIFSDLQQITWDDVRLPECRAQLARMEPLADFQLVDVGQGSEGNLAVDRLHIDTPVVAAGRAVQIQAEIQSYARGDRPRQAVDLLIDGERIAQRRVDCPANGRLAVSFPHRFAAPGEHLVEVHLADDGLPLDNRRWLSVPVREAVRVLCVGGRPNETRHVALALAPDAGEARHIDVVEAPESRLLEGELSDFDALIIANVGRLSRVEAAALHRFVAGGAGLIVFLGDQAQAENYNQLLVDDGKMRCLPARLLGLAPPGSYTFDPLDYRSPVVEPFRGFPKSGLLTTPTWEYMRLAPLEGAKIALGFSSGDPAIVETHIGWGRCILVATAASTESAAGKGDSTTAWTALSTWPSFPPLVHEILRGAIAGRDTNRNVIVGDDLTGIVFQRLTETAISLKGPGEIQERLPIREDAGERRWTLGQTALSGVYEAQLGVKKEFYAVNLDASEGNLTRLDPAELPSQLRHESGDAVNDSPALSPHVASSYFHWLLGAVFILLLVEPCLAWRLGRGQT